MSKCPENADSTSCGLELAQELIDQRAIIIDPFDDFGEPVRIRQDYMDELELLIPGDFRIQGRYEVADFCCTACLKTVQIFSSRDRMLATNADDIRTDE